MLSRAENERFRETIEKVSRHKIDDIEYIPVKAVEIMLEWLTERVKMHELHG